ncbi:hypothetical protein ADK57_38890 [Streptomyces sp. MMG1533]|nr:hypothetical protein ADK57_38890 [Streptomyces sp. MMG1533]
MKARSGSTVRSKDFIEVPELAIAGQHEEPIGREGTLGDLGLALPVDAARLAETVDVQLRLGVVRADESVGAIARARVVPGDLLAARSLISSRTVIRSGSPATSHSVSGSPVTVSSRKLTVAIRHLA